VLNNTVVSVVGLGYIGLPTAVAFASCGVKVIGVDVNKAVVDTINRGQIHIVEPDLDVAVSQAVKSGLLKATTTAEAADVFLIAVPTPFKGENHDPDLAYIEAACSAIAPVLQKGNLVILESTSPVGATEQMAHWLAQARPDLTFPQQRGKDADIRVAHCPERVLPGRVMIELSSNDRIIGGMTPACGEAAKKVYELFVRGECILTDARTAELCKLAENAFRDVNIAYANELSLVCDDYGINVWELIRLANRHPRVNILQPGAGVGGHCIAVDPWFIVSSSPESSRLIKAARNVNDHKPFWVLNKIRQAAAHVAAQEQKKPMVAVLGVAFKPNIDDLRESPALHIAQTLDQDEKIDLLIVEPHITETPKAINRGRLASLEEALELADVIVVLVKHDAFSGIRAASGAQTQHVIDAVGLVDGIGEAYLNRAGRSMVTSVAK